MTAPTGPTCARCGETVTPGARFCMKCGSDVSGEQGGVATAMMPAAQERDANDVVLEMLKSATIGEYEIHRELGRGGMATVYLAHDIALDRKVAVKVMSPALLLMGEGMSERFKREARTAANLSHPHIIPIYTVKSAGKTLFFVMKFIAGRSLEAIIKDLGPMPVPMAKAILQQVGNALGYAHRHGIVHRDVKPANIMIDEEGWSVVTDFGIAKVAENRALTMTGIAVGTPSYMSPEQCAAKDITGKSDQYSLGVVAYEMLSGKQPFEGDSAMAIMFAHFHEQPKPLGEVRADCPPDLAAAVMRMLEKAPDKRYPSMEEAIAALGAHALAHDDPIRLRLIELAKKGSTREILAQVTPPPTSPVPPAKTRAVAEAATTPVPVAAPRVTGISIAPGRSDLHVGDAMQLTATPRAAGGTAAGGKVEWATSNAAIATVSTTGLVTAVAPGAATISAVCEGVSGAAQVTVTAVPVAVVLVEPVDPVVAEGDELQLKATLREQHGATLHDREVLWRAVPARVATVSGAGLVSAVQEGVVEIIAESEGVKGNVRVTVTAPPVAAIAITPTAPTIAAGDTVTLEASLTDKRGKQLSGREVSWRSSAEAVAGVTNRGVVAGLGDGTAEITAACEGRQAMIKVQVTPAPVASVTIAEPKPIVAGDTIQLLATLKDARGQALTGREVKWSSSSPALATVTRDGHLTGMAVGSAKVSAECEGKSWTVGVTVLPVPVATVLIEGKGDGLTIGGKTALKAVVKDAKGHVLSGRDVAWTSSAPKVAAVGPDGLLTAKAPGEALVTATAEGKKAELKVSVAAPPPAPVPTPPPALAPVIQTPASVKAAAPAAATPAVADVPTEVIAPPPREPVVARPEPVQAPAEPVSAGGGKGKLIGALVALVVIGGIAFALLRKGGNQDIPTPVNPNPGPGPVASIEIAANEATLGLGRTEQFAANLKDAAGNELAGRPVSWSSTDPSVADVSANGAVTAKKAGTATIVALSEGKADSFNVAVEQSVADQPAAVASVALSGGGKALEVGETVQLAAVLKDAKGGAITDRTIVWSSSDPQVALTSSSGLVSAVGPGVSTISASSEGKSADLKLTVNAPKPPPKPVEPPVKPTEPPPTVVATVASVSLTPNTLALTTGSSGQFVAVAMDEKRRPLGERPMTWKSSDERIARVASDGSVSAIGKGKATITVSADGKSASGSVTVTEAAVAVAAVVLVPTSKSLKVGETATWSAAARDAKGKELSDRSVNWSSSTPKVATVSGNGVITAVAPGSSDIRAEAEGKSASERVSVVAAPAPIAPPPVVVAPPTTPTTTAPSSAGNAALLPRRAAAAGGAFSCGLAQSGAVCWGGVYSGLTAIEGTSGLSQLSVGRTHACGLLAGGRAVCWGENRMGQLGDGSTTSSNVAVAVAGDLSFSAISAGSGFTCGLAGVKAFCWGKGKEGQLGDGAATDRKKPSAVKSGQGFIAISAGGAHACAVTGAGKAYCWGDGFSGQLGFGGQDQQSEPVDVSGDQKFTRITAGGKHTCALTNAGRAYCWGANDAGQLGDGSKSDRSSPQAVASGQSFTEIAAGNNHTCALAGSEAFCWGENRLGQLGDGTKNDHNKPAAVSGGLSFSAISAGEGYSCGLAKGEAVCWGKNDKGQLGDGGTTPRGVPAPVRGD